MGKYNSEQVEWFLQEIASSDADEIESDELEILGESAEGVEGFFTISIRDVAESAAEEITRLRAKLAEAEGQDALYVVLDTDTGRPESEFVEIENAEGFSVEVFSVIDSGGFRRIGPLYTHPAPAKVPEGYALVPIKPTEAMMDAASEVFCNLKSSEWDDLLLGAYEAMLEAQGGE